MNILNLEGKIVVLGKYTGSSRESFFHEVEENDELIVSYRFGQGYGYAPSFGLLNLRTNKTITTTENSILLFLNKTKHVYSKI